mmetsp:Transcript_31451/g.91476  ORF Transcript_31451/g.91476 Transcript_31451/m.91476 type:complete len:237 (-) Transcript_31451:77-787(-)
MRAHCRGIPRRVAAQEPRMKQQCRRSLRVQPQCRELLGHHVSILDVAVVTLEVVKELHELHVRVHALVLVLGIFGMDGESPQKAKELRGFFEEALGLGAIEQVVAVESNGEIIAEEDKELGLDGLAVVLGSGLRIDDVVDGIHSMAPDVLEVAGARELGPKELEEHVLAHVYDLGGRGCDKLQQGLDHEVNGSRCGPANLVEVLPTSLKDGHDLEAEVTVLAHVLDEILPGLAHRG